MISSAAGPTLLSRTPLRRCTRKKVRPGREQARDWAVASPRTSWITPANKAGGQQVNHFNRRRFLLAALAVPAAAALPGRVSASAATHSLWMLDPDWGFPLSTSSGSDTKSRCRSCACHSAAPHRYFLSEADAIAGRLHPCCLAQPVRVDVCVDLNGLMPYYRRGSAAWTAAAQPCPMTSARRSTRQRAALPQKDPIPTHRPSRLLSRALRLARSRGSARAPRACLPRGRRRTPSWRPPRPRRSPESCWQLRRPLAPPTITAPR